MARFFYTDEQNQINDVSREIEIVNSDIERLAKRGGRKYNPPDIYRTDWLLFVSSKGDVVQEEYIRENYTRLQVLTRVLMRSIEVLHSYQDAEK